MKMDPNAGVLIVGSGNAALNAALAAFETGAQVTIVEAAPERLMGGNSRFTLGGFRFACDSPEDVLSLLDNLSREDRELVEQYSYNREQFYSDLIKLSGSEADPALCCMLAESSYAAVKRLRQLGVNWNIFISGLNPEPMWRAAPGNFYARGRGAGLIGKLCEIVSSRGIPTLYGYALKRLIATDRGRVKGAVLEYEGKEHQFACGSVVLACGGFEANAGMRREHLGEEWEQMKVRGSRFNTGTGLIAALELGAARSGEWSNGHAVPVASNAPNFGTLELGETTRRCLFQRGISVNKEGRRFMDEGAHKKWFMYSSTGVKVMSQAGGIAYQIFDARLLEANFEKEFYLSGVFTAEDSLEKLAETIDVDGLTLLDEIARYNAAVQDDSRFNPAMLDGSSAPGISPPRSNCATRIVRPPFFAFQVTGGITFTYGGVKIDTSGRVLNQVDRPIEGLFAAGEMAGGFFARTYPANSGLTRGAVTGFAAGRTAGLSCVENAFDE